MGDYEAFQCPGEPSRISRPVHLARLADGYPACRECPYRNDVEGLSQRIQRKLPSARHPKDPADFLDDEGVTGNLHEGFDASLAGRFAAAFGIGLRQEPASPEQYPTVAVASDGRSATQRHFAQIVDKLRWAGCNVVELGAVPSPALSLAIEKLGADGGLYVGNPRGNAHSSSIRFYVRDAQPVTGAASLHAICRWVANEPSRPVRVSGRASRADALRWYESRLADSFHGLRPLQFLLLTTCRPAGVCVERLLRNTACKITLRENETAVPVEPISETVGHFAVAIEDDGRCCRVWNERGEPVPFDQLFQLTAHIVCQADSRGRPVVMDEKLSAPVASALQQRGFQLHRCGSLPTEIHTAMVRTGAALGADRAGRLWYGEAGGRVIADALGTLTLLLGKLSEADRPLSVVLDAAVPAH